MKFIVYSFYDNLAKKSLFIVMHYTDVEAIRDFKKASKNEAFKEFGDDLQLVKIGTFDSVSLEFENLENEVLCVAEKDNNEVSTNG